MILTIKEYGIIFKKRETLNVTYEELATSIIEYELFPLSLEDIKKQAYLVPYLAAGKSPEAIIAIGTSKLYDGTIGFLPYITKQYKDFIILSKKEMLQVCTEYIKLIDKEKKEHLENASKRTK